MKETSTKTQAAIERTVTQPIILVSLGFSVPLRFSSRGDIAWDGYDWIGGRLTAGSLALRSRRAGGAEGAITLNNADAAITAVVLGEGTGGKTAEAWYLYGDPPYASDDAVPVFSGQMDGVPRIDDVVQIAVISSGLVQWTPRITFTPERFPHMRPAGTEINWGGEKFILQPSSEAS